MVHRRVHFLLSRVLPSSPPSMPNVSSNCRCSRCCPVARLFLLDVCKHGVVEEVYTLLTNQESLLHYCRPIATFNVLLRACHQGLTRTHNHTHALARVFACVFAHSLGTKRTNYATFRPIASSLHTYTTI